MYDLPALQPANDALWSALAAHLCARGIDAPARLTRLGELEALWADPSLLLGQTCGYPLVTSLRGKVRLVATPCYRAPGCEAGFYRSAVIVRASDPARGLADLRGRRCAINSMSSNSGMNVLRAALAPFAAGAPRFFDSVLTTGAHAASAAAVAGGDADLAAIDCVTWAHLCRLDPAMTGHLRVLCWTAATPGLPLITAGQADDALVLALDEALAAVWQDPALEDVRTVLLIDGLAHHKPGAYEALVALEHHASEAGYKLLQ